MIISSETRQMHRLFVAFCPPPAICDKLLSLMENVPGARWQSFEQLHLTLRYVGDVDRHGAEDVALALQNLSFSELPLNLSGVGSFEHKDQSRPIWAGIGPVAPLHDLHKKIDHALVRAGFPPEGRAYIPHITLARFGREKADVALWLLANTNLASETFMLDHIALFESHIGRDGARYEEVMRVNAR
jgi:RNA 2',3'-cyclic 3'-phosphodiesterase